MKVGRKLVVLAGLVALAAALALTMGAGQAKAATQQDVNTWLQSICVVGGQAYLIDDIWGGRGHPDRQHVAPR
jgi:hypothetical protein